MTDQLRELGPDAVVWLIAMACLVGVALAALAAALVTVAVTELRSWWWRRRAWRAWRAALPLHRRLRGGRGPLPYQVEPGERRRRDGGRELELEMPLPRGRFMDPDEIGSNDPPRRWWRRRRRWRDERRGR